MWLKYVAAPFHQQTVLVHFTTVMQHGHHSDIRQHSIPPPTPQVPLHFILLLAGQISLAGERATDTNFCQGEKLIISGEKKKSFYSKQVFREKISWTSVEGVQQQALRQRWRNSLLYLSSCSFIQDSCWKRSLSVHLVGRWWKLYSDCDVLQNRSAGRKRISANFWRWQRENFHLLSSWFIIMEDLPRSTSQGKFVADKAAVSTFSEVHSASTYETPLGTGGIGSQMDLTEVTESS